MPVYFLKTRVIIKRLKKQDAPPDGEFDIMTIMKICAGMCCACADDGAMDAYFLAAGKANVARPG